LPAEDLVPGSQRAKGEQLAWGVDLQDASFEGLEVFCRYDGYREDAKTKTRYCRVDGSPLQVRKKPPGLRGPLSPQEIFSNSINKSPTSIEKETSEELGLFLLFERATGEIIFSCLYADMKKSLEAVARELEKARAAGDGKNESPSVQSSLTEKKAKPELLVLPGATFPANFLIPGYIAERYRVDVKDSRLVEKLSSTSQLKLNRLQHSSPLQGKGETVGEL
jgi:hypothetical protein